MKNCLGIVPFVVTIGNGNLCRTYALIDYGADKTLCDDSLLKALNELGKSTTYQISTASHSSTIVYGKEVDLNVKATNTTDDNADRIFVRKVCSVK